MANPTFIKNYNAGADIPKFTIVKFGGSDGVVVKAAASTDAVIGVTYDVDAANGDRADVIHGGIADVKLGGTVARGDYIASDANGNGVVAPAAATSNVIGIALVSGVSGDIIPVLLSLGSVTKA